MKQRFPISGLDNSLIGLLNNIETVYEQLLEITAVSHKAQRFSIAIFGSARLNGHTPEFQFVSRLTEALVEHIDIDIVTGGGPGIMEAANQGLSKATNKINREVKNYGMKIRLPFEENSNPYLHIEKQHAYFTMRLQSFINLIQGAYISSGGIGTLLELSLLLQLKQVGHLPAHFPIVLDPVVWKPLMEKFNELVVTDRSESPLIDIDDINLITYSDDIDEIVEIFRRAHAQWKQEPDQ
jgi:predicted Rossmann-fold nucleotide-binding protein